MQKLICSLLRVRSEIYDYAMLVILLNVYMFSLVHFAIPEMSRIVRPESRPSFMCWKNFKGKAIGPVKDLLLWNYSIIAIPFRFINSSSILLLLFHWKCKKLLWNLTYLFKKWTWHSMTHCLSAKLQSTMFIEFYINL